MDDVRELYQQVILDHNKNPQNFGKLDHSNHSGEGYNPLCGDIITVYLEIEAGVIKDVCFESSGCAISKASASVMTTLVKGKTLEEVKRIFEEFQHLITASMDEEVDFEKVGKLAVFAGVREFPSRVKCAGLAWHTLISAIDGEEKVVKTE